MWTPLWTWVYYSNLKLTFHFWSFTDVDFGNIHMIEGLHSGMFPYLDTQVYHHVVEAGNIFFVDHQGILPGLYSCKPKNVFGFEKYFRIFICLLISQLHFPEITIMQIIHYFTQGQNILKLNITFLDKRC